MATVSGIFLYEKKGYVVEDEVQYVSRLGNKVSMYKMTKEESLLTSLLLICLQKLLKPKLFKDSQLIKEIKNIDTDIEKIATKSISEHGTGGMKTKIEAAKICQLSGCMMVIANGLLERPIKKIIEKNRVKVALVKADLKNPKNLWLVLPPKTNLYV